MIALYFQSFAAQLFPSAVAFFNQSAEQTHIGEKERILRFLFKSAANVCECYTLVLIMKMPKTLCKFSAPNGRRRVHFSLVQHDVVPLRRAFEFQFSGSATSCNPAAGSPSPTTQ